MDLVPNRWYAVLDPAEVPADKPVGRRRFGHDLVFWRDGDGSLHAAHDRCPHRAAALSRGTVTDGCLTCPFHGFRFDYSGQCVEVPAHPTLAISPAMRLIQLPVREAHDLVWLWSGPSEPDTGPIPFFETDGWVWKGSQVLVDTDVHYTRGVENQLDYAHLAFVHATTIGRFAPTEIDLVTTVEGDRISARLRGDDDGVHFLGPNIWKMNLSENLFNFLVFVPVDDTHMQYIVRTYQRWVTTQPFATAVSWLSSRANPVVLRQDIAVVESQRPVWSSLDNGEVYVKSDKPIIEFLKWRERQKDAVEHPIDQPLPAPRPRVVAK